MSKCVQTAGGEPVYIEGVVQTTVTGSGTQSDPFVVDVPFHNTIVLSGDQIEAAGFAIANGFTAQTLYLSHWGPYVTAYLNGAIGSLSATGVVGGDIANTTLMHFPEALAPTTAASASVGATGALSSYYFGAASGVPAVLRIVAVTSYFDGKSVTDYPVAAAWSYLTDPTVDTFAEFERLMGFATVSNPMPPMP